MDAETARVFEWALSPARDGDDEAALIAGLADLLGAAGLPLVRMSSSFRPIDPEVWARNVRWERDTGASIADRSYDQPNQPDFQGSAVEAIFAGAPAIREHVEAGATTYPKLDSFARLGVTDYLIQPIVLSATVRTFVSYATDRPGGFTAADFALLDAIHPAVAAIVRLRSTRLTTGSLLRTYLGSNAAARVLSGGVRRGHGARIDAAIWFCDLRGFTVLSQALPPDRLLTILDDYFEAVAHPVAQGGGEILKFIGDAVLAIFPVADHGEAEACVRAVTAAEEALARFSRDVDARHREIAGRELGMGMSLHVGDVFYGNIGARDRLDFTVIGPAVNLAARVQGMCTSLGTPLLLTGALATLTGRTDLVPLGAPPLKGIARAPELYTLARFRP